MTWARSARSLVAVATLIVAVAALAVSSSARADDLESWRRQLAREDAEQALAAARALAKAPQAQASELILDALSLGPQPRVVGALLEAVAARRPARALDTLALFVRHRSPEVRQKALSAAGQFSGEATNAIILAALGDENQAMRARAADLSAARRLAAAEEPLFALLRRGDRAAGPALAALASVDMTRRICELLGELPDDLLAATLGALLLRSDFGPEVLRFQVVRTLAKLPGSAGSPAVRDALAAYVKAVSDSSSRPSRAEAARVLGEKP